MMRPKISIIIPTYKPSELFFECLSSISVQSYDNFELIIILNGCDVPYESMISIWINDLKLESKTQLIKVKEGGVSNARNIGIDNANGEYIMFVDDDDLITNDYISELVKGIKGDETLIISNISLYPIPADCGPSIAFENISKKGFKSLYASRKVLNGPWMKLFPKNMIGPVRFDTHISLGEDALFCFTISKNIKFINETSPSAKYLYRLRNGGNSWVNKSACVLFSHMIYLMYRYTIIYFSSPLEYSLKLYLNRVGATVKSFTNSILNRIS